VHNGAGYRLVTGNPSRPFSTTMVQFRDNIQSIFYSDYKIIVIIVLLFLLIALIDIYLNKRLISFIKDTISLTGFITIYSLMMILLASSFGNYSFVTALHLRYMIPIFPFVVLFVFSSFSGIYNSKNTHHIVYKILPVILCILLVAQGANSLYFEANNIRMSSISYYSDREELNKYVAENNITPNDKMYIDHQISDTGWTIFQTMRHVKYATNDLWSVTINNNIPGKTILDNNITEPGSSVGSTSLAELIKRNKNSPIYIIIPPNVLQIYLKNSSKDLCLINPVKLSNFIICKVDLKNNKTCNTDPFPRDYIIDNRTSITTSLAGNFIGQKHDQLLILKSNPSSTKENILLIIDFAKVPPVRVEYDDRLGTAWLASNHSLLSGDFMGLGYDQALNIAGGKIIIEDFSRGKAPAITRYSESLANDSALRNLAEAGDALLAGDFLERGYSQVLFIDRKARGGKLVIADFSKGKTPEMTEFSEIEGNSTLLSSLLDDKDKQFSGDFMGLGHSQLLMINCNHTGAKEPQIIIADFSKGKKSASLRYLENWGESTSFSGWLDADDTQLVGDFMGLGHSQVLFVNHNHAGGKIRIDNFSQGKPPANIWYWESWDQGTIFQGWLGINDTRIAGDFKKLGYSQVLFLNRSINRSNATIIEFINGKPMISL
jgi:hypothetical protein